MMGNTRKSGNQDSATSDREPDSAEKAQHQEDKSEIGDRVGGPADPRNAHPPKRRSVKPDVR
jgi:hypothetical protein